MGRTHPTPSMRTRRLLALLAGLLGAAALVVGALREQLGVDPRLAARPARPAGARGCSVRVNTFRRNDLLAGFVEHYERCEAAAEIVVVWSDPANAPLRGLARRGARGGAAPLRVERFAEDSLNNRFALQRRPAADAVFSVDDDVILACADLRRLVDAWAAAPANMAGVAPRLVARDARTRRWRYLRSWHVWWTGRFSLVLTKAAVLHRDHFAAYRAPALAAARARVDAGRICEDRLMACVVANATRAPPLSVSARYVDRGQALLGLGGHQGISAAAGHVAARGECLDAFAGPFGGLPLATGAAKLSDARAAWLW